MKKIIVFPAPKMLVYDKGFLDVSSGLKVYGNPLALKAKRKLKSVLQYCRRKENDVMPALRFSIDSGIASQGYRINIFSDAAEIIHSDERGAYYGALTFIQIASQAENALPCLKIDDCPDFEDRGLMLDISRNKVPTLKTLKKLVDYLSEIKINQLQLYIEGLSFYYKSFDKYYENGNDFLTAEDIRALDKYCSDRFIELVPNQNSFGHFAQWLHKDELKHLGELSEAFFYEGVTKMLPSTLNPYAEGSIELISKLCEDLLPNFTSKRFNVCGDEPFELGLGASRDACEEKGKGKVYMDFMYKVFEVARKHNKTKIMLFGDVLKNHPETIDALPDDVIALEWGYNDNSFNDEVCKLYSDRNVAFYVCPGTSMWNTVAGKSDFMLANIKGAAHYGSKHGAKGLLNTDWGDGGTCQQYALTLFPYGAGAAYSWNAAAEQDELLRNYLDKFAFLDKEENTAKLIYDLGNYYKLPDSDDCNATKIFKMLYVQQTDNLNFGINFEPLFMIKDYKLLTSAEYSRTEAYLRALLARAKELSPECVDGGLVKDEILWAISYLIHGCVLGQFKTDLNIQKEETLYGLRSDIADLLGRYKQIWKKRNKKSAMRWSILRMQSLLNKYDALIKNINIT